jgi:hypothetical protein
VADIIDRVIDSTRSGTGLGPGTIASLCESRASSRPTRRRAPLPWRDELYHEPPVGADLSTADERWLLALAGRSADWYQTVTGVAWTPAGRAFFLGRLTAISRHWSDPSGHGLHRGWHLSGPAGTERAPWTSKREREICWPALDPRPVCRRQGDAVTRLVLGTPTCPGHFDLLRHGLDSDGRGAPGRHVQSWATAVYLCDPVTATTATNARYQRVRAAAAQHHAVHADEGLWDFQQTHVREFLLSA